jgi:hypothetical protein
MCLPTNRTCFGGDVVLDRLKITGTDGLSARYPSALKHVDYSEAASRV